MSLHLQELSPGYETSLSDAALKNLRQYFPQYEDNRRGDERRKDKGEVDGILVLKVTQNGQFSVDEVIYILENCNPNNIEEYNAHLVKLGCLVYESKLDEKQMARVQKKMVSLMGQLSTFISADDPLHSKLYTTVEKCFDIFIRICTNHKNVAVASASIRFLTNLIMSLNYWEIYNLLSWKPSLYHFLSVIQFDLKECYNRFTNDYAKYNHRQYELRERQISAVEAKHTKSRRRTLSESGNPASSVSDDSFGTYEAASGSSTPSSFLYANAQNDDQGKPLMDEVTGLTAKQRRKLNAEAKLAAHRVIKKTPTVRQSKKSSNYDPDVVHECQLPSADEPDKMCLRRFSRKYELIRHQETVHSKKKKLFKCYVCVKQNPSVGPRIFTRHDTLAKHIRVNHKISGREAKAEVAYSKKHAEVVEEGDITVHVGRRKTKVDFELRAHMEKRKSSKGSSDIDDESIDTAVGDIMDSPGMIDSEETFE